ncbi:hypothetical protein BT69DRAFT_1287320 [Atractiella rhizophila]|nr:hypothetical protein BT69DRAFT_1287320 [Atractiella rhizophila]
METFPHPSWDNIVIEFNWLRFTNLERYHKILNQLGSTCFLTSEEWCFACQLPSDWFSSSSSNSTAMMPAAPSQFLILDSNSDACVVSTPNDERQDSVSASQCRNAHLEPFPFAPLIPRERFSQKIRAFPRELGYIYLQEGTDAFIRIVGAGLEEMAENQFERCDPTQIHLPACLYPTVFFRGAKVFSWSRGYARSAWVNGVAFAYAGYCQCRRFTWFRDEEMKCLEDKENDEPLVLAPFPKSPAELREHTKRCRLKELLPEFLQILEVTSRHL